MSDVAGMSLGQFLTWLIQFGLTSIEPLVAQAIEDFRNDRITAEEADRIAEGKFSRAMALLADPRAESAKLVEETERRIHEKFDRTDAAPAPDEEPK